MMANDIIRDNATTHWLFLCVSSSIAAQWRLVTEVWVMVIRRWWALASMVQTSINRFLTKFVMMMFRFKFCRFDSSRATCTASLLLLLLLFTCAFWISTMLETWIFGARRLIWSTNSTTDALHAAARWLKKWCRLIGAASVAHLTWCILVFTSFTTKVRSRRDVHIIRSTDFLHRCVSCASDILTATWHTALSTRLLERLLLASLRLLHLIELLLTVSLHYGLSLTAATWNTSAS